MKLAAKEFLFAEGEPTDALYIVKEGSLHAIRRERDRLDVIETFGPGSIIGDLPIPGAATRPYSVRAEEDSELQKITREDTEQNLLSMPHWFRCLLRNLIERRTKLEKRTRRYLSIHALPALLAVLDYFVRTSDEDFISFESVAERLYSLNGIRTSDSERLCKALASLGLFEFSGTEIQMRHPTVVSMLYETIRYRALHKELPPQLLNASEQLMLTRFAKAATNGNIFEEHFTEISGEDFAKAAESKIKFTHKHLARLVERKILYLETGSTKEDFSIEDRLYGDVEYIHDLLELNRIYPELDHGLANLL